MNEELSRLPIGETGRILERLPLLKQIIGRPQVRQVLENAGAPIRNLASEILYGGSKRGETHHLTRMEVSP